MARISISKKNDYISLIAVAIEVKSKCQPAVIRSFDFEFSGTFIVNREINIMKHICISTSNKEVEHFIPPPKKTNKKKLKFNFHHFHFSSQNVLI